MADPDKPADDVETLETERVPYRTGTEPTSSNSARLTQSRRYTALVVALTADAVQVLAAPLFASGALSPVVDALDVLVGVAMIGLVGWHWAFLPTLIAELVPVVDLVPSWTLAWWIATRRKPELRPPAA